MVTKKHFGDYVWFVNGMVIGIATILLGLAVFSKWANAATYNMMFNNVEQGPNSTANPKVTVIGGKATKSAGTDTENAADVGNPTENATPNGAVAPAVAGAASESTAATIAKLEEQAHRPVRLGFLANSLNVENSGLTNRVGGTLSLGFFPLKDFGVNTFIGTSPNAPQAYYGGEVEFIPVRAGIFGWKDALEIKTMVGASTLGRGMGTQGERGSMHGGLGATVNFGDRYGVTAEMRTNLSNRSDYKYWLANAGLVVRF